MRVLFICIFAICLAIGLHFGYETWQTRAQNEVLFERLTSYVVPTITHNGITYTITDTGLQNISSARQNKLLQLAYFSVVARVDPLLALPGVDLETFRMVIEELEMSQEKIASVYSSEDREIIQASLYPISFLKSLHTLEQLRRQLIETPSFNDAEVYQQQFNETYELYVKDIQTLWYAIEAQDSNNEEITQTTEAQASNNEEITQTTLQFHVGSTTVKTITNLLVSYQNGITQVYETQLDRFRCYKGVIEYCFNITRPQASLAVESTASDAYKTTILQNQSFIKAFRENPYRGYSHPSYTSAELSTSECGESDKPGYYHLWWLEDTSRLAIFRPDLLHEFVLLDLWNGELAFYWPFASAYRTHGGPQYIYQSIANHYFCPDLGLDMTTILSMLYVSDKALYLTPIRPTPQPEIDSLITTVNFAYDAIKSDDSQQLTQEAVERYINALHTLLTSVPEPDLYAYIGTIPTQTAHDLLTTYQAKTGYVSEALISVVSNNKVAPFFSLYDAQIILENLLLLRTAPILLYGGFNPTVQPHPHTIIQKNIPPEQPLPFTVISSSDLKTIDTTIFIQKLQEAEQVNIDMAAAVGIFYLTNSSN